MQQLHLVPHLVGVGNEREAVRAVAVDGSDRWDELYRTHAPEALRLAYLITGSRQAAEDLTQDAFVKVMGRLMHLRDESSFKNYLRRTVINLTKMHFRRKDVERRHAEPETPESARNLETSVADVDLVRHALNDLPHKQRVAIVLRYYADWSDTQIAEQLGCAEGTVRSLLSRASARLRDSIGGDARG